MDINNIQLQLQMLSTVGYTLTVQEKLRLKMARSVLLNNSQDADDIKFWGNSIINTSLNDFQFKQLPQLLIQHDPLSSNFNTQMFSGDPNKILVNLEGQSGQQAPPAEQPQQGQQGQKKQTIFDDEDQEIKKAPKKNFTELHRLSYVVRAIQHDAQIVPRDSYRMSPQHELHVNNKFYGLNHQSALSYSNWLHFRSPQTSEARQNIQQDAVIFNSNFLDNLENDLPKGVWSLQLDHQHKNVNVRNLFWPGYYAFHRLNSAFFGSVYIGEGLKNADLPFMI